MTTFRLITILILLSFLSACGGGGDEPEEQGPPTASINKTGNQKPVCSIPGNCS